MNGEEVRIHDVSNGINVGETKKVKYNELKKRNKNVFFFKQKTAYELKEGDWSSDVCSSDLWLT